jgi:alpha-glucosidase (family GH31 glycosyl hydrolase)
MDAAGLLLPLHMQPKQRPGSRPEPGRLLSQANVRVALTDRYILPPYLYTLFFHTYYCGRPVVRPLFFEFPSDNTTHPITR